MNYHNITHDDMNNGDGLRVVLWLSGCSHHCYKCQNPQTWNPNSGILFDEDAKQEIFDELSKDYISGITFSGGDPLDKWNINDLDSLIYEIKEEFPNKTIWIYTGYTFDFLEKRYKMFCSTYLPYYYREDYADFLRWSIIKKCDILVDGQYIDSERDITLKWRGSKNQRVIDVQKSLSENKIVLYCD